MSRTKTRSTTHNNTDLKVLLHDAERALSNTAGAASEKFSALRERLSSAMEASRTEAVRRAKQADEMVRENPYYAAGIAAGVGALVGILVSRRFSTSR
jgi:ElaB/YqjD/DUF883 family membrane-anchored ribosome-binding protein